MIDPSVMTGTNAVTIYLTTIDWRGHPIVIQSCRECGHEQFEVLHHVDEQGYHWCPTGFLYCPQCGGFGDEPKPYECSKWGEL